MYLLRLLIRTASALFLVAFGAAAALAAPGDWARVSFPVVVQELSAQPVDLTNTARAPPAAGSNVMATGTALAQDGHQWMVDPDGNVGIVTPDGSFVSDANDIERIVAPKGGDFKSFKATDTEYTIRTKTYDGSNVVELDISGNPKPYLGADLKGTYSNGELRIHGYGTEVKGQQIGTELILPH